jgi:hypothetical protein
MAGTKVPIINWSANDGELVSKLITELERPENFKVFLGKKEKYDVSDMPFITYSSIINTHQRIQVGIQRQRLQKGWDRPSFRSCIRSTRRWLGTA